MARLLAKDPAHRILSCRDPSGWPIPTIMVASGGALSERYGHEGPGVCLGDGQTQAVGVPLQGGRGDALLRRMPHGSFTLSAEQHGQVFKQSRATCKTPSSINSCVYLETCNDFQRNMGFRCYSHVPWLCGSLYIGSEYRQISFSQHTAIIYR